MALINLFRKKADKPMTQDALIAYIKGESDPAKINKALLNASKQKPFWPAALTGFFIEAKNDSILDGKLLAAAALSAKVREQHLAQERTANRDGAFTNFIYVNHEKIGESCVFKVVRSAFTGGGNGAWGGLRDPEDKNIHATIRREIYEEVIDAARLILTVNNASNLEKDLNDCMTNAINNGKSLADGVADFIAFLSDKPELQTAIQIFTQDANSLIDDLINAGKHNLFICRDDAHAIERGWGFIVNAHAHVSEISKETAEKFNNLRLQVEELKKEAARKGLSQVAGEMQGIVTYTMDEAPQKIRDNHFGHGAHKEIGKNHYGHEALAEMAGFVKLIIKNSNLNFGQQNALTRDFWDRCNEAGTIDIIAKKMRLGQINIRNLYTIAALNDSGEGYHSVKDADYASAASGKKVKGLELPKSGK